MRWNFDGSRKTAAEPILHPRVGIMGGVGERGTARLQDDEKVWNLVIACRDDTRTGERACVMVEVSGAFDLPM